VDFRKEEKKPVTREQVHGVNQIEVVDPFLLCNILLSLIISIEVMYNQCDYVFVLCQIFDIPINVCVIVDTGLKTIAQI
jgi:hypothetical protein